MDISSGVGTAQEGQGESAVTAPPPAGPPHGELSALLVLKPGFAFSGLSRRRGL